MATQLIIYAAILLLINIASCAPSTTCSIVARPTPRPDPMLCGVHGTLKNRSLLLPPLAIDGQDEEYGFEQCRDACIANADCISLEWNRITRFCRLLDQPLRKQGLTNPAEDRGLDHYHRDCWVEKCSKVATTQDELEATSIASGAIATTTTITSD